MQEALPAILILAMWVFSIAFIMAARQLTHAILDPIIAVAGLVPLLGRVLGRAIGGVENAINQALAKAEHGVDKALGASWHQLSRFVEWQLREIEGLADFLSTAAHYIKQALTMSAHAVNVAVGHNAGIKALKASVKTLEKKWHGIDTRVKELERKWTKGIGHDLRVQVKALEDWKAGAEHAIDTTIPQAIAGAEADLGAFKQWLGVKLNISYKDWAAGIVLAGLGVLGLKGLNCDKNPFKNNRNACGLYGDLSQLLGVIATVAAVANFEELVKEMQHVEEGVATGLHDLLNL